MKDQNQTADRIIQAFIELFRDYGYKGTTTRAIAERAGVNEVTIFRHFGNKQGMMNAVIQSLSYHPMLDKMIQEQMTWNLEHDLMVIAESYHRYMDKIKDLVLIGLRESDRFPELKETIMQFPKQLKISMVAYFTEMKSRGMLIATDIEYQAMNFIWLNFGFFLSKSRFNNDIMSGSTEEFIKHSVSLFARGLTP